ncbi:MAG: hypothetical protein DI552_04075 [Brevundimonas sp.]|nr:MAG: hypothetical protein DI552_04075 [Brevundimonas sp.]
MRERSSPEERSVTGEGDRPRVSPEASPRTGYTVEGATPRAESGFAPSTMLRMVPLPRFAGEDR